MLDGLVPDDIGSTTPVPITVLSVTPMRAGKLFALASVEIDIDGVLIEIHGIRAVHVPPAATRIELPTFRDTSGSTRAAIILPEEVRGPIGDAVLGQLVERGLAVKRPAFTANSAGP
jgi:stage V sporulation protein G